MDCLKLAGCVALPYTGFILGSSLPLKNISWESSLKHPRFRPPAWVFAPVWTCLYGSMGIASYLVLREIDNGANVALPLSVYGAHLLVNWSWAPVYYKLHMLKAVRTLVLVYLFSSRPLYQWQR